MDGGLDHRAAVIQKGPLKVIDKIVCCAMATGFAHGWNGSGSRLRLGLLGGSRRVVGGWLLPCRVIIKLHNPWPGNHFRHSISSLII
jgi:hypothetical protein